MEEVVVPGALGPWEEVEAGQEGYSGLGTAWQAVVAWAWA